MNINKFNQQTLSYQLGNDKYLFEANLNHSCTENNFFNEKHDRLV